MPTVTERWWISLAHFPHLDMLLCIYLVLTAPFVLFVFWPEVETLILRSELSVLVPGVWRRWFPDKRQSGCMHVWLVEFVMLHVCLFQDKYSAPGVFLYQYSFMWIQLSNVRVNRTISQRPFETTVSEKKKQHFQRIIQRAVCKLMLAEGNQSVKLVHKYTKWKCSVRKIMKKISSTYFHFWGSVFCYSIWSSAKSSRLAKKKKKKQEIYSHRQEC